MNQPVFNHQGFTIDKETRKKVVRQDRHYPDKAKHFIEINKSLFRIENYSSFGIAIRDYQNTAVEKIKCVYFVDEVEICDLEIQFVRHDREKELTIFSVENHPLPIEAIKAMEIVKSTVNEFEVEVEKYKNLPSSFKNAAHEFKNWIEKLERKVDDLSKTTFASTNKELNLYEESVAHFVSQYLMSNIHIHSGILGSSLQGLPGVEIKKCYEYLRMQVGNVFYKSPYANRAFNKPRGYAGDFEMMNNVYFNELRGETLFSKCVQRFFTDNPAGKAVRNRAVYINQKINLAVKHNPHARILGVASGPAKEIQKFYSEQPEIAKNCEIHLLDQDTDALKFSQKEIFEICKTKGVKPNIYFHNLAIKDIINEGLSLGKFDLIYSAGLFDYFTDPVALFAAKQLFNCVSSNGKLIIGNFGSDNPAQFIMEALGDWYLIYRDKKQLEDLYSSITNDLYIESESEGVNLFAIFNK